MLPESGNFKLLGCQWPGLALHVENNCHLVHVVDYVVVCDVFTHHDCV
jgi:hypothetical protein